MCYTRPGKWLLCICVLGVSILSLSTILIFDIGIVPTVWYFCCFPFIVFIYVTWYTIAISYDASVVQVEQELLILLSTWGNPVLAGFVLLHLYFVMYSILWYLLTFMFAYIPKENTTIEPLFNWICLTSTELQWYNITKNDNKVKIWNCTIKL